MISIAEHAVGAVRRTLPAVLDLDLLRRCYPLRYLGLMAVCFVLMRPIMVGQTPALAAMMKVLTAWQELAEKTPETGSSSVLAPPGLVAVEDDLVELSSRIKLPMQRRGRPYGTVTMPELPWVDGFYTAIFKKKN